MSASASGIFSSKELVETKEQPKNEALVTHLSNALTTILLTTLRNDQMHSDSASAYSSVHLGPDSQLSSAIRTYIHSAIDLALTNLSKSQKEALERIRRGDQSPLLLLNFCKTITKEALRKLLNDTLFKVLPTNEKAIERITRSVISDYIDSPEEELTDEENDENIDELIFSCDL